ncbi:hypothetical protein N7466_010454 [Penicillium verhagenii]|uniref:uncharacterized protein n=1 Tax=Penicillium verhagenii TaxID=1562060 RepID=UPI00254583E1|nr:uncharacterized protein N7466_010454 [Penicillium verhagenii]KAJ5918462.1 hypothetical protein N7466_010454 [Penicillium verhagenii]
MLTAENYFISLSVVATLLLWGVSLWNGTVLELILTVWRGHFEDGTPFFASYTGFFPLDFPIGLLVAFFFYGTNGSHPGYQVFLIDAYSTLQSAFVWLYIESYRPSSKPSTISRPILWGLLWQAAGAAISLPLFYYHHLKWISNVGAHKVGAPDSTSADVLSLSFLLGAVAPAVIGMLPTWGPREDIRHQKILAAWQPDPVWVSIFQVIFIAILSQARRGNIDAHLNRRRGVYFVYGLAALSSAIGHLYASIVIYRSSDLELTWSRIYIPNLFHGPPDATTLLAKGPWLFLQYDLIIIALSSLSWAYVVACRSSDRQSSVRLFLPFLLFIGQVVLGAGATVSLVLLWRETVMARKEDSMKSGSLRTRKTK